MDWLWKVDVDISHKIATHNNSWIIDLCLFIPCHLFRPYGYPVLVFLFAYSFPRVEYLMLGNDQVS